MVSSRWHDWCLPHVERHPFYFARAISRFDLRSPVMTIILILVFLSLAVIGLLAYLIKRQTRLSNDLWSHLGVHASPEVADNHSPPPK